MAGPLDRNQSAAAATRVVRTQLFERCDATPALAQCQELVELVTAYLDAAQDTAARERFEQHLQRCDGCAAYLEELRVTVATVGALAHEQLHAAFRARLLEAFAATAGSG